MRSLSLQRRLVLSLLLVALNVRVSAAEPGAAKQELHVAPAGSDGNSGTPDAPLPTLAAAVQRLKQGGVVVLHEGTYPVPATVAVTVPEITIRAAGNAAVVLTHADDAGPLLAVSAEGVTIESLILDGRFVAGSRAIKGTRATHKLVVTNCEIKNFTRHAVDLDGADCRIEGCHIHHILYWSAPQGAREDAHGIVTMYSKRLQIKDCRIDHVSGDCFQADRGAWQDVTIDGCDFSNGALEEDMAGFKRGASPGEDGIDTKVAVGVERARLVVRRTRFHDFRSSFIKTPAALNLKENVEAVVDGCDLSDSVVALRLRGTGRGVMWPTIVNCTIRDCNVAVRYEDNLQKFHFAHNTLASCRRLFEPAPEKTPWGQGWIVTNNLFVDIGRLPREARGTNAILPLKSVDPETLRPAEASLKQLAGTPAEGAVPAWYAPRVEFDHAGRERSKDAPTIGAYELSGE